jgi:F420H(2)-dependent quinone reductase
MASIATEPSLNLFEQSRSGPNAVQRLSQHVAASKIGVMALRLTLQPSDMLLFRLFGGRINMTGIVIGRPETVLITTKGNKSGKPHTVPMLAHPGDGDSIVIIGTNYGKRHHPSWYHNLKADPAIEVTYMNQTWRFRAREATEGERRRHWQTAQQRYIGYDRYQQYAGGRQIPVMVLEPVRDEADVNAN